jgi:hypothetical protein
MPPTTVAFKSPEPYKSPFLSDLVVELIQKHGYPRTYCGDERFASYRTEHGEWRIGYGSSRIGKTWAGPSTKASRDEINQQLVKDLEVLAEKISSYVIMPLSPKKRGALLSYAHSVGLSYFKDSPLLELINSRATKLEIIKEWSPLINPLYRFANEHVQKRRQVELNMYLSTDTEVHGFVRHVCKSDQCLLTIGESFIGTPNQVRALEYLEKELSTLDPSGKVLKQFFRHWGKPHKGVASFRPA